MIISRYDSNISYFPCIVDLIIQIPKELSITYIPCVGVFAYATSSNFGKLQFSLPHTALPSPHPTGNFLINYFLIIFQFFLLRFVSVIFILDIKSRCVIKWTCIFWYKCTYDFQKWVGSDNTFQNVMGMAIHCRN